MQKRQVEALTKRKQDGTPYTRRVEVETALASLVNLSRDEMLERLEVRQPTSPNYVQSECLVYLIRAARNDNDERYFNKLYRELMRRLASALPRIEGERARGPENVYGADARDSVRDIFKARLIEDRAAPGSALDYFEVMFSGAVAALRKTSMSRARGQMARRDVIDDEESGEPSIAVEKAVGSLDVKQELLSDDPNYRSKVAKAIRTLPDKQRRVIEMLLQDMPIDSIDDDVLTIRKILGVRSEKTVRNRRDAAIATIREQLGIGSRND
ncbi:DNA-binding response regulator [uncultured Aureimonas sp.]|uniref:RNA polymerase sigma factor n=1 Tax=uncultured Aureimonas sp. TaxID=1604662 RepID=UPI0025FD68BE|nr:DNA-binding response regulator [uncultured Aureimonas sp.]